MSIIEISGGVQLRKSGWTESSRHLPPSCLLSGGSVGRKPAGDGRVVNLENTLLQAAGKHGGACG
jgi:hypothetical protein